MSKYSIARCPDTFLPGEYSFMDLNRWLSQNYSALPAYIGMTEAQEQWYRQLLPPQYVEPKVVYFNGIPIIIQDQEHG